ncbi:MAG TPA: sulfite exporter TauE/SafE family protein [Terriglobales bacterium]|nr:sulfite exporter TauE/SafE family protein [Terriglobales bacterium]
MTGLAIIGEAVALGLASGPACVASCGPVLVPTLLVERSGWRANTLCLGTFLSLRFVGYMLFAAIASAVGQLATVSVSTRALVFGIVHLLLAVALVVYARAAGRACAGACRKPQLVNIGVDPRRAVPNAALLGLLTGVSLCPPFVAAGLRAAQLGSLIGAIAFFAAFFVGTSLWFIPFCGIGWVRRNEGILTVARMAMVLIACYYAYVGFALLIGRSVHGY